MIGVLTRLAIAAWCERHVGPPDGAIPYSEWAPKHKWRSVLIGPKLWCAGVETPLPLEWLGSKAPADGRWHRLGGDLGEGYAWSAYVRRGSIGVTVQEIAVVDNRRWRRFRRRIRSWFPRWLWATLATIAVLSVAAGG